MPRAQPYHVGLTERLRDADYAAAYLNAARQESQAVFLLALRDIVQTHRISKVALAAGVNRETLYRTLSARGNPTLTTLDSILETVGVEPEYRVQGRRTTLAQVSNVPICVQNAESSTSKLQLCNRLPGQEPSARFVAPWARSAFSGLLTASNLNLSVYTTGATGIRFDNSALVASASNAPNGGYTGTLEQY